MNQFRISLRNLWRHKRYVIPNVLGLGIALGALLIIFQFVSFQLSFDRFYENDLCRVISTKFQNGDLLQKSSVTYSAVGPALVDGFPEIEKQSRVFPFGNSIVHTEQQESHTIYRGVAVEQSFFQMFEMDFLAGNREEAFEEPNQLVLTTSSARTLYPNEAYSDLIGKTVKLDNDADLYLISGIVEDMPENSHLSYHLFMSYPTIINTWGIRQAANDWRMIDFRHYVQLRDGVDLNSLNQKLEGFGQEHLTFTDTDYDRFELEHVKDVYLSDHDLAYDIALQGDRQTVYLVLCLGLLLFLVSWINFVNLNSSLALERAKTMGIRRILGASRQSLRARLALDIALMYALALSLGIMLSVAATRIFQDAGYAVKGLEALLEGNYLHYPLAIALLLLLLSGAVLAFLLYFKVNLASKDTDVVRARSGEKVRGQGKAGYALLTVQFVLSLMAFCMGLIIHQQQRHINGAPLGFNLDGLWVIQQPKLTRNDSTFKARLEVFKNELLSNPQISHVATNQRTPGQQVQVDYEASFDQKTGALSYIFVDDDYLETYEMELLAGRNFRDLEVVVNWQNSRHIIINEQALPFLEVSSAQEAIGKRIRLLGSEREVIGVMANYRQQPVFYDIQSLVLLPIMSAHHQLVVKSSVPLDNWLGQAESAFQDAFPSNSFEYRNLAAEYDANYASIYSITRAMESFTFLTVLISLFGILALAFLNMLSRVREFGIRKVLGATHGSLYFGVLKVYWRIFLLAFVISAPLVFYLATEWLSQFNYRISISPFTLLAPGLIIAGLIAGVIFLVSRKIIRSNAIDALRTE